MSDTKATGDTVIIKKYANRRLYNTRSSSYITLDHLSKMTRDGVEFRVIDAKTGADLTHQILTQIIMEEESTGEQMLPVKFLRQLISMYGNSIQSMIPHYLDASMEHFRANQIKLQQSFEESIGANPLARMAQQNMEIFKAATTAFMPGGEAGQHIHHKHADDKAGDDNQHGGNAASAAGHKAGENDHDIAKLRVQMAEMQKKLDALAK